MVSEPTKIVNQLTDGIVDLFSSNESRERKIKIFLSIVTIVFLIIPILFHILAFQEIQIQSNILAELSSVETSALSPEMLEKYNLLIDKCCNSRLLINDINSTVISYAEKLTASAISLYQTEISGRFQYVGYGFKVDLFKPVFIWNIIPLAVFSIIIIIILIVELKDEHKGFKKVLYHLLWSTGILIIAVTYSLILAFVLSLLFPIVFFSVEFTIGTVVFVSLVITFLFLRKLFW